MPHQNQNLIIEQFVIAWNRGDLNKLLNLMTEDISFYADGGGKVKASTKPLHGHTKISRFLLAIKRSRLIPNFNSEIVLVNERLGILNTVNQKPQSVFSFYFTQDKISTIFAVVNPDKLKVKS